MTEHNTNEPINVSWSFTQEELEEIERCVEEWTYNCTSDELRSGLRCQLAWCRWISDKTNDSGPYDECRHRMKLAGFDGNIDTTVKGMSVDVKSTLTKRPILSVQTELNLEVSVRNGFPADRYVMLLEHGDEICFVGWATRDQVAKKHRETGLDPVCLQIPYIERPHTFVCSALQPT